MYRTLFLVILLVPSIALAELKYVGSNPETGFSEAVIINGDLLVQTGQIFPKLKSSENASVENQFVQLMNQVKAVLENSGSSMKDLVKLNFYVTRDDVAGAVREQWKNKNENWASPSVCFVTTALPVKGVDVAVDVLAKTSGKVTDGIAERKKVTDNGAYLSTASYPSQRMVYISGQAEKGTLPEATTKTLQSLHRSLEWMGLDSSHVVQIKLFLKPMSDSSVVYRQIEEFYRQLGVKTLPAISLVEWTNGLPIEIEMVAVYPEEKEFLRKTSAQYLTVPGMTFSPVYCRVAVTHSPKLVYISGQYSGDDLAGQGERELRDVYSRLESVLESANSSFDYMIKATYYVSDDTTSSAFTPVRMELYNHLRPPAASKASVNGVGRSGHTVTIDMIAIPVD